MNPTLLSPVFFYFLFASFASNASASLLRRDFDMSLTLLEAHGLVMSIAFLIIMPLGVLLVRSLKFKGSVWIHAGCQMVGWVLMIAGLCLGERTGKITYELYNNTHTILGTVVVALLLIQPFIGLVHHRRYLSTKKAGAWTYLHVWYGRILILLGIINGGLGLQLADDSMSGMIAYGVVAGIVGVMYCVGMVVFELKRARQGKNTTSNVTPEDGSKPETA